MLQHDMRAALRRKEEESPRIRARTSLEIQSINWFAVTQPREKPVIFIWLPTLVSKLLLLKWLKLVFGYGRKTQIKMKVWDKRWLDLTLKFWRLMIYFSDKIRHIPRESKAKSRESRVESRRVESQESRVGSRDPSRDSGFCELANKYCSRSCQQFCWQDRTNIWPIKGRL